MEIQSGAAAALVYLARSQWCPVAGVARSAFRGIAHAADAAEPGSPMSPAKSAVRVDVVQPRRLLVEATTLAADQYR